MKNLKIGNAPVGLWKMKKNLCSLLGLLLGSAAFAVPLKELRFPTTMTRENIRGAYAVCMNEQFSSYLPRALFTSYGIHIPPSGTCDSGLTVFHDNHGRETWATTYDCDLRNTMRTQNAGMDVFMASFSPSSNTTFPLAFYRESMVAEWPDITWHAKLKPEDSSRVPFFVVKVLSPARQDCVVTHDQYGREIGKCTDIPEVLDRVYVANASVSPTGSIQPNWLHFINSATGVEGSALPFIETQSLIECVMAHQNLSWK